MKYGDFGNKKAYKRRLMPDAYQASNNAHHAKAQEPATE
jgi:hypothetical protein